MNGRPPAFDTIVDSALFHIFGEEPELRAEYVRSLHSVCEPGGRLHILALSNREPGIGPASATTSSANRSPTVGNWRS